MKTVHGISGVYISEPGKEKLLVLSHGIETNEGDKVNSSFKDPRISSYSKDIFQKGEAISEQYNSGKLDEASLSCCLTQRSPAPVKRINNGFDDSNNHQMHENEMRILQDIFVKIFNSLLNSQEKKYTTDDLVRLIMRNLSAEPARLNLTNNTYLNDDHIDKINDCINVIVEMIIEKKWAKFKKVDLTKKFQKKFNAKIIDKALNELCIEGIITKIKKAKRSKSGRNPSPEFSVNELRFKEIEGRNITYDRTIT